MKPITIIYFFVLLVAAIFNGYHASLFEWESEALNFGTGFLGTSLTLLFLNRTTDLFNYSNKLDSVCNLMILFSGVLFLFVCGILILFDYSFSETSEQLTFMWILGLSSSLTALALYHSTKKVPKPDN